MINQNPYKTMAFCKWYDAQKQACQQCWVIGWIWNKHQHVIVVFSFSLEKLSNYKVNQIKAYV